jgi:hypothetical protein
VEYKDFLSFSYYAEPHANFAGSRPNSRASMVEERNAEQDENESADDAHFTGEGVA